MGRKMMIRTLGFATALMATMVTPGFTQTPPSMTLPVPSTLRPVPPAAVPAQPTAPAFAPSHLQAARDFLVVSGVNGNFDGILPEFYTRMQQQFAATRPELAKPLDEVMVGLKPDADQLIKTMSDRAAEFMAARLSEADLKEVVAFFNSPVGKRYQEGRPLAMNDIFNALQPWSIATSDFLFKRTREEMAKRGFQL
jgi:uncharacterized protein